MYIASQEWAHIEKRKLWLTDDRLGSRTNTTAECGPFFLAETV